MADAPQLTTSTKFFFGLGDWGASAAATARNVFWFVFLTNVVGLDAGLAGIVVLVGRIWDSVNDPLIGALSDRMRSRWGRRRPFLLFGAIPFAATFVLMFYVPPVQSPAALVAYYSLVFLLFDTLFTIVNVPYLAMMPELTYEYDERSSLTGWRIAFSILAALITAGAFKLLAEHVFAAWLGGGPEAIRQGYLLSAVLWAITIAVPYLLVFRFVREPDIEPVHSPIRPFQNFREVYANRPFLLAALIYLLCFTTGDIILVVLVRYLIDYIHVTPGFDSVVLVTVLGMALLSTPLVVRLMLRTDKRTAYLITISFMTLVLILANFVPQGAQYSFLFGSALAGVGYAAMSVIPWAIVSDVIEADELKTGERREGLYAGFLVLLRKWASAFAIFAVGRLLSETGFISSTSGSAFIQQPESALNAMRFLVSVIPAIALIISLILAWRFPIDRETYQNIRRQLDERRALNQVQRTF